MNIRIRMKDHSSDVINQLEKNVTAALTAMGTEAVGLIVSTMRTGYGRPIWRTGDLQRDVNYNVRAGDNAVDVGNSLEYGHFVHDGTSRMAGRPYITDALTSGDGMEALKSVAQDALGQGFD